MSTARDKPFIDCNTGNTGSPLQQARGQVNVRRDEVIAVVHTALSARNISRDLLDEIYASLSEHLEAVNDLERIEAAELRMVTRG